MPRRVCEWLARVFSFFCVLFVFLLPFFSGQLWTASGKYCLIPEGELIRECTFMMTQDDMHLLIKRHVLDITIGSRDWQF